MKSCVAGGPQHLSSFDLALSCLLATAPDLPGPRAAKVPPMLQSPFPKLSPRLLQELRRLIGPLRRVGSAITDWPTRTPPPQTIIQRPQCEGPARRPDRARRRSGPLA